MPENEIPNIAAICLNMSNHAAEYLDQYRDLLYKHKHDLCNSQNPKIIEYVENNLNELADWEALSTNKLAYSICENNPKMVDWELATKCNYPEFDDLFEKNSEYFNKVCWFNLFHSLDISKKRQQFLEQNRPTHYVTTAQYLQEYKPKLRRMPKIYGNNGIEDYRIYERPVYNKRRRFTQTTQTAQIDNSLNKCFEESLNISEKTKEKNEASEKDIESFESVDDYINYRNKYFEKEKEIYNICKNNEIYFHNNLKRTFSTAYDDFNYYVDDYAENITF